MNQRENTIFLAYYASLVKSIGDKYYFVNTIMQVFLCFLRIKQENDKMNMEVITIGADNFNTDVGQKIYALRTEKGMSRAELGKLVHLHESTVKRYEDGDIKSVSLEKIEHFAKALGVSPAYLMGWDNSAFTTIAAHHEGEDWTEEELKEIENFKKYILSKRKR